MKTIAWDVDDVLNDLTRAWFEQFWEPAHLACARGYDQLVENPPDKLLGITRAEYLASLDAFRLSEIASAMKPVSEVLAWFQRHGSSFRHLALTATPLRAAPNSAAWVLRHFGTWIRSFHLVPSPRADETIPVYDETKADFLRWFGKVDVFVDDNPANTRAAEQLGIQTILIPRPWNSNQLTLAQTLDVLTECLSRATRRV
jgi:FMN phosphatase YigB (HAD superfamily)